ncbi:uncharacterized protein LOC114518645 [Dendronephthya gigantea]|uniref:uncharacterized protein LOC114518645 n=1 Tax=Dendronephthya gigantea TaxID=151771 RepID=UPI00106A0BA5|nr:uncharacterized protein LOC114518645 [Dendronephthya gigantea]
MVFLPIVVRYKCGNCGINLLSNSYECFCCSELEGCEEALKCKEVLEELKAEGILDVKCIMQHPGFSQVCLQKWSLKLAADRYKTKSRARYCQEGTENRFICSVSYREFTRLVHGLIGNKQIPLPSCAYMAIRKVFPVNEKENYTGYAEESDSE